MSSRYAKGARLERLARASLMRHGYRVIRSAGSKGAVDLAAFKQDDILLVQVKASRTLAPARKCRCHPHRPAQTCDLSCPARSPQAILGAHQERVGGSRGRLHDHFHHPGESRIGG
ncbi:hypothetical protein FJY94_04645 [Candidatus Kaiserbacteria bacterium]|nr:hypothetical protein [Candidatus Kaiserbacteria bacterium]